MFVTYIPPEGLVAVTFVGSLRLAEDRALYKALCRIDTERFEQRIVAGPMVSTAGAGMNHRSVNQPWTSRSLVRSRVQLLR